MSEPVFDAVVLAGGQGSRMGGVSKADLLVGGERLLDRVLRAAADARTRVVVGAVAVPDGVTLTREDPPGTGPAAGIVAGLDAVGLPSPWTLVLACDLPDAPAAVAALLAATSGVGEDTDGACLTDADGAPQHLLALYRTPALRAACADYGDPRNRSVRRMVAPLRLMGVAAGRASAEDIDTWEQHARWNGTQHPPAETNRSTP